MKLLTKLLLIPVLFIASSCTQSTIDAVTPVDDIIEEEGTNKNFSDTLTITSPNYRDTFILQDSSFDITWTSPYSESLLVKISILQNGLVHTSDYTRNTGSLSWRIDNTYECDSSYQIKIHPYWDSTFVVISDSFSINGGCQSDSWESDQAWIAASLIMNNETQERTLSSRNPDWIKFPIDKGISSQITIKAEYPTGFYSYLASEVASNTNEISYDEGTTYTNSYSNVSDTVYINIFTLNSAWSNLNGIEVSECYSYTVELKEID